MDRAGKNQPVEVRMPYHHRGLNKVCFFTPEAESFWMALGNSLFESLLRFRVSRGIYDRVLNRFTQSLERASNIAERANKLEEYHAFVELFQTIQEIEHSGQIRQFSNLMNTDPRALFVMKEGMKIIIASIAQDREILRLNAWNHENVIKYLVGLANVLSIHVLMAYPDGRHKIIQNKNKRHSILLTLFTDMNQYGVLYNDEMINFTYRRVKQFPYFHRVNHPQNPLEMLGEFFQDRFEHIFGRNPDEEDPQVEPRANRQNRQRNPRANAQNRQDPPENAQNPPANPENRQNPPANARNRQQHLNVKHIDCIKCRKRGKESHIDCHKICDDCRAVTLKFGLIKCTECDRDFTEEELNLLMGKIERPLNIFPVGTIKCEVCKTVKPVAQKFKVECRCIVCLDCSELERTCLCHIENEDYECVCCTELLKDPFETPCGHLICWECAFRWFPYRSVCPLDNLEIDCSLVKRSEKTKQEIDCFIEGFLANTKQQSDEDLMVEVFAWKLLNPHESLLRIQEHLYYYTYQNANVPEKVQKLLRCTQLATQLSNQSCWHPSPVLVNTGCIQQHCIECLRFYARAAEENSLPTICPCGSILSLTF